MEDYEGRFDFHGLGQAIRKAREERGWTQEYVSELVGRGARTIMNIENKGQYAAAFSVALAAVPAAFAPCFAAALASFAYWRLIFHFCAMRERALLWSSVCSAAIC